MKNFKNVKYLADFYEFHEISIYMNYSKALNMIKKLYNNLMLDSFCISLEPPFTVCSTYKNGIVKKPNNILIKFVLRSLQQDAIDDFLILLKELFKYVDTVDFKNKLTGYSLDKNGYVLEQWELDDGGC